MEKTAQFSKCGLYRYVLTREWDKSLPIAMCIGLNPSTASFDKDDPTIRLLVKVLRELKYGGLMMTNLYALVSSKPESLSESPDPLKDNDLWLDIIADRCHDVIFCWGSFKQAGYRAKKMREKFLEAKCFGKNKDGSPWHPLAMMYAGVKMRDVTLEKF